MCPVRILLTYICVQSESSSLTYAYPVRILLTCICVSVRIPHLHVYQSESPTCICVSVRIPHLHMCVSQNPPLAYVCQSESPTCMCISQNPPLAYVSPVRIPHLHMCVSQNPPNLHVSVRIPHLHMCVSPNPRNLHMCQSESCPVRIPPHLYRFCLSQSFDSISVSPISFLTLVLTISLNNLYTPLNAYIYILCYIY